MYFKRAPFYMAFVAGIAGLFLAQTFAPNGLKPLTNHLLDYPSSIPTIVSVHSNIPRVISVPAKTHPLLWQPFSKINVSVVSTGDPAEDCMLAGGTYAHGRCSTTSSVVKPPTNPVDKGERDNTPGTTTIRDDVYTDINGSQQYRYGYKLKATDTYLDTTNGQGCTDGQGTISGTYCAPNGSRYNVATASTAQAASNFNNAVANKVANLSNAQITQIAKTLSYNTCSPEDTRCNAMTVASSLIVADKATVANVVDIQQANADIQSKIAAFLDPSKSLSEISGCTSNACAGLTNEIYLKSLGITDVEISSLVLKRQQNTLSNTNLQNSILLYQDPTKSTTEKAREYCKNRPLGEMNSCVSDVSRNPQTLLDGLDPQSTDYAKIIAEADRLKQLQATQATQNARANEFLTTTAEDLTKKYCPGGRGGDTCDALLAGGLLTGVGIEPSKAQEIYNQKQANIILNAYTHDSLIPLKTLDYQTEYTAQLTACRTRAVSQGVSGNGCEQVAASNAQTAVAKSEEQNNGVYRRSNEAVALLAACQALGGANCTGLMTSIDSLTAVAGSAELTALDIQSAKLTNRQEAAAYTAISTKLPQDRLDQITAAVQNGDATYVQAAAAVDGLIRSDPLTAFTLGFNAFTTGRLERGNTMLMSAHNVNNNYYGELATLAGSALSFGTVRPNELASMFGMQQFDANKMVIGGLIQGGDAAAIAVAGAAAPLAPSLGVFLGTGMGVAASTQMVGSAADTCTRIGQAGITQADCNSSVAMATISIAGTGLGVIGQSIQAVKNGAEVGYLTGVIGQTAEGTSATAQIINKALPIANLAVSGLSTVTFTEMAVKTCSTPGVSELDCSSSIMMAIASSTGFASSAFAGLGLTSEVAAAQASTISTMFSPHVASSVLFALSACSKLRDTVNADTTAMCAMGLSGLGQTSIEIAGTAKPANPLVTPADRTITASPEELVRLKLIEAQKVVNDWQGVADSTSGKGENATQIQLKLAEARSVLTKVQAEYGKIVVENTNNILQNDLKKVSDIGQKPTTLPDGRTRIISDLADPAVRSAVERLNNLANAVEASRGYSMDAYQAEIFYTPEGIETSVKAMGPGSGKSSVITPFELAKEIKSAYLGANPTDVLEIINQQFLSTEAQRNFAKNNLGDMYYIGEDGQVLRIDPTKESFDPSNVCAAQAPSLISKAFACTTTPNTVISVEDLKAKLADETANVTLFTSRAGLDFNHLQGDSWGTALTKGEYGSFHFVIDEGAKDLLNQLSVANKPPTLIPTTDRTLFEEIKSNSPTTTKLIEERIASIQDSSLENPVTKQANGHFTPDPITYTNSLQEISSQTIAKIENQNRSFLDRLLGRTSPESPELATLKELNNRLKDATTDTARNTANNELLNFLSRDGNNPVIADLSARSSYLGDIWDQLGMTRTDFGLSADGKTLNLRSSKGDNGQTYSQAGKQLALYSVGGEMLRSMGLDTSALPALDQLTMTAHGNTNTITNLYSELRRGGNTLVFLDGTPDALYHLGLGGMQGTPEKVPVQHLKNVSNYSTDATLVDQISTNIQAENSKLHAVVLGDTLIDYDRATSDLLQRNTQVKETYIAQYQSNGDEFFIQNANGSRSVTKAEWDAAVHARAQNDPSQGLVVIQGRDSALDLSVSTDSLSIRWHNDIPRESIGTRSIQDSTTQGIYRDRLLVDRTSQNLIAQLEAQGHSRAEATAMVSDAQGYYIYSHESLGIDPSGRNLESILATQHADHLNNLRLQSTLTELANTQKNAITALESLKSDLGLPNSSKLDQFIESAKTEGERVQTVYSHEFALDSLKSQDAIVNEVYTRAQRETLRLELLFESATNELGLNESQQAKLRETWGLDKTPMTRGELDAKLLDPTTSITPRDFTKPFNNPSAELEYWASNNSTAPDTAPQYRVPTEAWIQATDSAPRTAPTTAANTAKAPSLLSRITTTIQSWFPTKTDTPAPPVVASRVGVATLTIPRAIPITTLISRSDFSSLVLETDTGSVYTIANNQITIDDSSPIPFDISHLPGISENITRIRYNNANLSTNRYTSAGLTLDETSPIAEILHNPDFYSLAIETGDGVEISIVRDASGLVYREIYPNNVGNIEHPYDSGTDHLPTPSDTTVISYNGRDLPASAYLQPTNTTNSLSPTTQVPTTLSRLIINVARYANSLSSILFPQNNQTQIAELTPLNTFLDQSQSTLDDSYKINENMLSNAFADLLSTGPDVNYWRDIFTESLQIRKKYNVNFIVFAADGTVDFEKTTLFFKNRLSAMGWTIVENATITEEDPIEGWKAAVNSGTKTLYLRNSLDNTALSTLIHEYIHTQQVNIPRRYTREREAIIGTILFRNFDNVINSNNPRLYFESVMDKAGKETSTISSAQQFLNNLKSIRLGIYDPRNWLDVARQLRQDYKNNTLLQTLKDVWVTVVSDFKKGLSQPGFKGQALVGNSDSQNNQGSFQNISNFFEGDAVATIDDYITDPHYGYPPSQINIVKSQKDLYQFQMDLINKARSNQITYPFIKDSLKYLQSRGVTIHVLTEKQMEKKTQSKNTGSAFVISTKRSVNWLGTVTETKIADLYVLDPTSLASIYNVSIDQAMIIMAQKIGHEGGHALDSLELGMGESRAEIWATEIRQKAFNIYFFDAIGLTKIANKYADFILSLEPYTQVIISPKSLGCSSCDIVIPQIISLALSAKTEAEINSTIKAHHDHTYKDQHLQTAVQAVLVAIKAGITHESVDYDASLRAIAATRTLISKYGSIEAGTSTINLPLSISALPSALQEVLTTLPVRGTLAAAMVKDHLQSLSDLESYLTAQHSQAKQSSPLTIFARFLSDLGLYLNQKSGDLMGRGRDNTPSTSAVTTPPTDITTNSNTKISKEFIETNTPKITQIYSQLNSISNQLRLIHNNPQVLDAIKTFEHAIGSIGTDNSLEYILYNIHLLSYQMYDQTTTPQELATLISASENFTNNIVAIAQLQPTFTNLTIEEKLSTIPQEVVFNSLINNGIDQTIFNVEDAHKEVVNPKMIIAIRTDPRLTNGENININSPDNLMSYLEWYNASMRGRDKNAFNKMVSDITNGIFNFDEASFNDSEIELLEINGIYVVLNGNHRALAAMVAGVDTMPAKVYHVKTGVRVPLKTIVDKIKLLLDFETYNTIHPSEPTITPPLDFTTLPGSSNQSLGILPRPNMAVVRFLASLLTRAQDFGKSVGSYISQKYHSLSGSSKLAPSDSMPLKQVMINNQMLYIPKDETIQNMVRFVDQVIGATYENSQRMPGCRGNHCLVAAQIMTAVADASVNWMAETHEIRVLNNSRGVANVDSFTDHAVVILTHRSTGQQYIVDLTFNPDKKQVVETGIDYTQSGTATELMQTGYLPISELTNYLNLTVDSTARSEASTIHDPMAYWETVYSNPNIYHVFYENEINPTIAIINSFVTGVPITDTTSAPTNPPDPQSLNPDIAIFNQSTLPPSDLVISKFNNSTLWNKPIQLPPVSSELAKKIFLYNEILGTFKTYSEVDTLTLMNPPVTLHRSDLATLQDDLGKLNEQFHKQVLANDPSLTTSDGIRDAQLTDRYIISTQVFGEGGMGQVWLGWDTTLLKPIIIKTTKSDDITLEYNLSDSNIQAGLQAEARLGARINRQNVAWTYDTFIRRNKAYFVMDYVPGPTLQQYLYHYKELGIPVDRSTITQILGTVAEQLDAIHSVQVGENEPLLIRDLKPGGIILDPGHGPTIIDLGNSPTVLATIDPTKELSPFTPAYASKNQIRGYKPTKIDDNRALMVIAFESLTGYPAFTGGHSAEVLANIMSDSWNNAEYTSPFRSLRNFSKIQDFFDLAFKEDPDFYAQYPTATSLMDRLKELLGVAPLAPITTYTLQKNVDTVLDTYPPDQALKLGISAGESILDSPWISPLRQLQKWLVTIIPKTKYATNDAQGWGGFRGQVLNPIPFKSPILDPASLDQDKIYLANMPTKGDLLESAVQLIKYHLPKKGKLIFTMLGKVYLEIPDINSLTEPKLLEALQNAQLSETDPQLYIYSENTNPGSWRGSIDIFISNISTPNTGIVSLVLQSGPSHTVYSPATSIPANTQLIFSDNISHAFTTSNTPISVGVSPQNTIVIPDSLDSKGIVSREHVKIYYDETNQSWYLEDTNSTNGTYLNSPNSLLIPKIPMKLNSGDVVHLGEYGYLRFLVTIDSDQKLKITTRSSPLDTISK